MSKGHLLDKLVKEMEPAIVRGAVRTALNKGDTRMIIYLLDRVTPKQVPTKPKEVLRALRKGKISLADAKMVLDVIEKKLAVDELEELQQRVAELETKLNPH